MPLPIFLPSRRAYAENEEDDGYIALLSEPEKGEKVNPAATVITTGWMTSVAPLTLLASAWAAHVEGIAPKAPKAKTDELSMQEQARLLVEDAAAIDVFGRRARRGEIGEIVPYTRAENRFARRWADTRASTGGGPVLFRVPVDCEDFHPPLANSLAMEVARSLRRYMAPGVRIHLYPAPAL